MDPHGDLQQQPVERRFPAPGERLPPAHRALAVRDRPPRPRGREDRGCLQRARARGRAAEGRQGLRLVALALAAGLLAVAAAPAAASDKRTVKHVAPGLSWTRIARSAGPERIN